MTRLRSVGCALAVAALAGGAVASCGRGGGTTRIEAVVASFDVAAGSNGRFLFGLTTSDGRLIGFGAVRARFHAPAGGGSGTAGPERDATFLVIPGTDVPAPLPAQPLLVDAVHGRGVYTLQAGFDRAGVWTLEVDGAVESLGRVHATTDFLVRDRHRVGAVGDRAPATRNLTLSHHDGLSLRAVDSRAQGTAAVPDPELHSTTIADALAAHRPIVAVFSTPVYCQSRFCGPVTDVVAAVAKEHAGRAAFVHVEIYRDFERGEVNDAALEWLARDGGDLNEPWVFVIDRRGTVTARFDNVMTRDELETALTDGL